MRFLIVDDSKAVQAIVRRALQKAGIADLDYKAANDGNEALKVMNDWQPDMVLTDWHMPGMTGIELLKAIRERGWNDLKVGFITTESARDNVAEARRLGAAFVINKPFQDDDLIRAINGVMGEAPTLELAQLVVTVATPESVASHVGRLFEGKMGVIELPRERADEIHLPSAVALYAHERSGEIRALCLLDHKAIVLVGATAAGRVLPDIARLLEAKEWPKEIWERMELVLRDAVPELFVASDRSRLKLVKTQLMKQKPEQMGEIMRRSPYRSDFALSRGKLAPGQLTLISK